jgi:phenylalanyl-tRNA synthetase beta chain
MICSESELGLGEDHSGILVLDGEPELGVGFEELVELPDVVFELAITPNRPDAMSLVGLARDLAARFDTGFRVPPRPLHTVAGSAHVKVEIGDPVGCRRFTAREIRGVTVGKSPLWVRHRLRKAGVRAISNVVDVTNYVMLELGHPLHAFDADAIVDDRLVVKRASDGETLVTLDGEERALGPEDLIIYDGDGPTSMSGTMGGARSEVSDSTTSVLMEAASWDPPTIMYMSRRHGLRSEASTRFERGVDPNLTNEANARAAAMVIELAGGEILEGLVDEVARPIEPVRVELRSRDVEQLLGPGIDETEVIGILTRLGMAVEGSEPIIVSVPTFRPDVFRPADLVEEVARIHGYEKFGASLPTGPAGGLTPEQRRLRKLLSTLVGAGVTQAVTIPFVTEEGLTAFGHDDPARLLRVINPLRDEESVLRPSLLPGLLAAARHNVAYGARSVSLFETGRVFLAEPDRNDPRLPLQTDRIAVVLVGAVGPSVLGKAGHQADADVALALVRLVMTALGHDDHRITSEPVPGLHPSRSAAVTLNGEPIGHAGELSPRVVSSFDLPGRVAVAELDLAPLLAPVPSVIGESPSPFPNIDFDLSFLLPLDVPVGDLVRVTVEAGSGMVESARVFDVFRGRGVAESERAVAINYRLRSPEQTLTNEEVQPVRLAMIAAGEGLGARLRGA